MKDKIKKIITNRYFWFTIFFAFLLIHLWNREVRYGSGDAYETWEVVKSFFSNNIYGSYVMYKGVYAFVLETISYNLGLFLHIPEFLFLKIAKSLMLSYICIFGIPNIIEDIFKYKPKIWQILIFSACTFLIERGTFILLSVDLLSFFIFVLTINLCTNCLKKEKKYKFFIIGLLLGIGSCLSGQYLISTFIILAYFVVNIIIKHHKEISILLITIFLVLFGFAIAKGINYYFENEIVDELREKGAWIPEGGDWIKLGLSRDMAMINYPANIKDNLSLSVSYHDDAEKYQALISGGVEVYNFKDYFKLIIKNPLMFIARWVERLFLGLMADPLNAFPTAYRLGNLVIALMGTTLVILWDYIRKHLKTIKDLISKPAILFYAFIFSVAVPTFSHVENRYYMACRVMLIGILILTPKLNNFIEKIKNKQIKFSNINMTFVSCILFSLICITVYYTLYQSCGVSDILFKL